MAAWRASLRTSSSGCSVVAEILDTRSKSLIADLALCDCVLTTELVSRTLALLAEDPRLDDVFGELFSANGCGLSVVPAAMYVRPGERLSFWQIARRARARRHVLVGIRCAAMSAQKGDESSSTVAWSGAVKPRHVLNPADKMTPLLWQPGDSVVVMAQDPALRRVAPGKRTSSIA
jgi:hypothetical protein